MNAATGTSQYNGFNQLTMSTLEAGGCILRNVPGTTDRCLILDVAGNLITTIYEQKNTVLQYIATGMLLPKASISGGAVQWYSDAAVLARQKYRLSQLLKG